MHNDIRPRTSQCVYCYSSRLLQEGVGDDIHGLHPQEYHTRLTSWQASQHGNILIVAGGDHEGMKHGTFDVLEKYGIAFRIEGKEHRLLESAAGYRLHGYASQLD